MIGVVLLAVAVTYLGLCGFSRRRSFMVRGHEVDLPSFRLALAQLAISTSHWLAMAAVPWSLLNGAVDYPTVLTVLMVAAIAGVIMHIPGGLGVIEAVFIALLSHKVPTHQILAALLAYRALFYLLPLAIGALLYVKVEMRTRKQLPAT